MSKLPVPVVWFSGMAGFPAGTGEPGGSSARSSSRRTDAIGCSASLEKINSSTLAVCAVSAACGLSVGANVGACGLPMGSPRPEFGDSCCPFDDVSSLPVNSRLTAIAKVCEAPGLPAATTPASTSSNFVMRESVLAMYASILAIMLPIASRISVWNLSCLLRRRMLLASCLGNSKRERSGLALTA